MNTNKRLLLQFDHRIKPSLAVNGRQLIRVFGSGVPWATSRVSGRTQIPIIISTINRNVNSYSAFFLLS